MGIERYRVLYRLENGSLASYKSTGEHLKASEGQWFTDNNNRLQQGPSDSEVHIYERVN